uniref:Uncharacterized protein n=1 Tax=Riboviria sp. TaxID=2585031 RepID=A0A8K1U2I6_9VIRU|nr:MAG: hypothetical protein 2 [Riboviria sp.]
MCDSAKADYDTWEVFGSTSLYFVRTTLKVYLWYIWHTLTPALAYVCVYALTLAPEVLEDLATLTVTTATMPVRFAYRKTKGAMASMFAPETFINGNPHTPHIGSYQYPDPTHPLVDSLLAQKEFELQSGGSFFDQVSPAFQASIWVEVPGRSSLLGHAVRIHNHLVTLWHVLNAGPIDQMVLKVRREGKPTFVVPLVEFKWETLFGDVAYATLEGKPIPGLKNARAVALPLKQFATITTDHQNNNSSIGEVSSSTEGWGMVKCTAAVRQGFCGAGYYAGTALYGIHTVGGKSIQLGLGYSAQYVAMKIASLQSSDYEMLMESMARFGADRYRVGHRTLDEVEVYHRGNYYRIENDELDMLYEQYPYDEYNDEDMEVRAQPTRRARQHRRQPAREEPEWDDYELQAGAFEHPALVPVYDEAPPLPPLIDLADPEELPPVELAPEPENSSGAQTILPGPPSVSDSDIVSRIAAQLLAPLAANLETLTQTISSGLQLQQETLQRLSQSMTRLQEGRIRPSQNPPRQQNATSSQPNTQSPTQPATHNGSNRSRRQRNNGRRQSGPSTSTDQQALEPSQTTPPSRTPSDGTVSDALIRRIATVCVTQLNSGLPPSYVESQMDAIVDVPAGVDHAPTAQQTSN